MASLVVTCKLAACGALRYRIQNTAGNATAFRRLDAHRAIAHWLAVISKRAGILSPEIVEYKA
jgi:hypothetical protein